MNGQTPAGDVSNAPKFGDEPGFWRKGKVRIGKDFDAEHPEVIRLFEQGE